MNTCFFLIFWCSYPVTAEDKLPLSQRDRRQLEQLLLDSAVEDHASIGAELEAMLLAGVKAEIEAVPLADFITTKVNTNQWV